MRRTAQGHLNALQSKLGHAAQIGGVAYVERVATSDEFAAVFMAVDAKARKKALGTVQRVLQKARPTPPLTPPRQGERIKLRWTDELIARFKQTAPWVRDNKLLAARLGLPEYCADALRRARYRYLPKAHATKTTPERRQIESPAADLPLAA